MQISKQMLSVLLILVLAFGVYAADDDTSITQYFDKTADEISGLSDTGVKPNKDWFDDSVFDPMVAILERIQTERNLKDYDDPDDAVVAGYRTTVPAGTHTITQTGVQNTDAISMENNTALLGVGYSSIIEGVKTTASEALILAKIDNDSNVVISGIDFRHDTTGVGDYGLEYDAAIFIIGATKNVIIENCKFSPIGDGIYIGGPSDSTHFPENVIVRNCVFYGDSLAGYNTPTARNGVSITGGKNIFVINNTFDGFWNVGCVDIEPNTRNVTSNIVVSGNTIYNRGFGITCSGNTFTDVVISDNIIDGSKYNNSKSGIHFTANSAYYPDRHKNIIVANNIIHSTQSTTYQGIRIGAFNSYINFIGNTIHGCATSGFYIAPPSLGLNVTNNTAYSNGDYGFYMLHQTRDSTATAMVDPNMETDDAAWVDVGTPSTNAIDATEVFQGSYSRKIVTDAADEGLGQTLISRPDSLLYELRVRVLLTVADEMQDSVYLQINGAERVWEGLPIRNPNNEDGDGWRLLQCVFMPSGNDVLQILGSDATMTFFVDSVEVWLQHGHQLLNFTNNTAYENNRNDNTKDGMNLGALLYSSIKNNTTFDDGRGFDSDTLQTYGMQVYNSFWTTILDNKGYGNELSDCRFSRLSECAISFKGFEVPFWNRDSLWTNNSYPYAHTLFFMEDSIAQNRTADAMDWNDPGGDGRVPMPQSGRIIAMAGAVSDGVTAGSINMYPQIGFQVPAAISARDYLYITITGTDTIEVRKALQPIMIHDALKFRAGDLVGVSISTDASFTPANVSASASILWE